MNITKLTASFGCLERETLTLAPGLNILSIPNEGGKSTWCAFLRVMLYGIDTRERDRKGVIADKNRFRPWSGAPMEGVLECEYRGRPLTLRRFAKGSAPMGGFSAVWSDTGEPVEGMTGENAGELLTGVGREVFERSAFLRQSGLAVDQAPELERRIAALVTSGQEDVSYTQAEGRLREWLRRRKYNKSGQIPRLEEELADVEGTLRAMDHATARMAAARGELEELNRRRAELEGDMHVHQRLAQRELNRQYAVAGEALAEAEAEEAAAAAALNRYGPPPAPEQLRRAQDALACLRAAEGTLRGPEEFEGEQQALLARCRDPRFPDLNPEELWENALEDDRTVRGHQEAQNRRSRLTVPVLIVSGLIGLAVGLLLWFRRPDLPALAILAGLGIPAVVNSVRRTVCRQQERAEQEETDELLRQHQVKDAEEILPAAQTALEGMREARQALKELLRRKEAAASARTEWEGQMANLLNFIHTFAPEVNDLFGASAALSRALTQLEKQKVAALRRESARQLYDALAAQGARDFDTLEMLYPPPLDRDATAARLGAVQGELARVQSALDTAQGEQQALGDPARLMAQAGQLREQLDRLRLDYAALETALDALQTANSGLRSRVSPALNREAGALMSRLTGGRYDRVSLDRDFEAAAEEAGGLVPRPVPALSQGTADQLYLAVRLAVCRLVLPPDDPCPLVLDDALTNFDDDRMALALELLDSLAEERQILLFTCHSRERAWMAQRRGESTDDWAGRRAGRPS